MPPKRKARETEAPPLWTDLLPMDIRKFLMRYLEKGERIPADWGQAYLQLKMNEAALLAARPLESDDPFLRMVQTSPHVSGQKLMKEAYKAERAALGAKARRVGAVKKRLLKSA
jgi:hypothetical protein